jgi:HAD superfamily hydrolase (TIGR01509 family)
VNSIRAILFDAHGVLYDRSLSTDAFVAELLARHGYTVAIAAADGPRLKTMKADASCSRVGYEAYWDSFLLARGVRPADQAPLREAILAQTHQVVPMPGAEQTSRALKQLGLRTGIVTDTMYPLDWKMIWLAQIGVAEYVDAVACSTAVGAHKPDPRIYQHALDRLDVQSGQAMFVGHATHELDGARRLGITTVAVNYDADARADHYLSELTEFLTLPTLRPSLA